MTRQPRYDPNHPHIDFYLSKKFTDFSIIPKVEKSLNGREIPDSIPVHFFQLVTHPLFPQLWVPDNVVTEEKAKEDSSKKESLSKNTPKKGSSSKENNKNQNRQKELIIECEYLETIEALLWSVYTNQELKAMPKIHEKLSTADLLLLVGDMLTYWKSIVNHEYSYEDVKGFENNAISPYWDEIINNLDWTSSSENNKKLIKSAIEICIKFDTHLEPNGEEYRPISWNLLKNIDAKLIEGWVKNMEIPEVGIAWACCSGASNEQIKKVLAGIVYYEKEDDKRKDYKILLDKDSLDLCYAKGKTIEVVEFVSDHCIVEDSNDKFPDDYDTTKVFVYRPIIDTDADDEDGSGGDDEDGDDENADEDEDVDSDGSEDDGAEEEEEENKDIEKIDRSRKPRPKPKPTAKAKKEEETKKEKDKDEESDEVINTDEDEDD